MHQSVGGLPGLPLAGGLAGRWRWGGGRVSPGDDCGLALDGSLPPESKTNLKRKKTEFSTAPQQRESTLRAEASWEPALRVAPVTYMTFLPTAEPAGRCPESICQPVSACHFVKNKKTTKPLLKAVNTKVCQRKWWELHYLNPFRIA